MNTCIFTKDEQKLVIGLRKVLVVKRALKKSPGKFSTLYYLPILKNEALQLRLTEDSLLKAEVGTLLTTSKDEVSAETSV